MALTKASWDAAMTSIGERLRAREALEATFQALIDLGLGQAIAAVQNEIAPIAAQAQTDAAAVAALLDALIHNGVPTAMVETSPSARFVSDAEMAAKASASALADLVAAVALKAPLASPAFTGAPSAPTPAGADNSTKLATTAFVKAAIAGLVDSAPGALDTLDELAAALGDDANFASTVTSALAMRLRFDAAQALTAPQKAQALDNLGAGDLATQDAVTGTQLPAGAWVVLAELVANDSALLEDTTHLTAAYDEYEIAFLNLRPANDGVSLRAVLYAEGAWRSTGYSSLCNVNNAAGGANLHQTDYIDLTGSNVGRLKNSGGVYLNGKIFLHTPAPLCCKRLFGQTAFGDTTQGGSSALTNISASWNGGVGAITGIRFAMDAGNIADGKIIISGKKK